MGALRPDRAYAHETSDFTSEDLHMDAGGGTGPRRDGVLRPGRAFGRPRHIAAHGTVPERVAVSDVVTEPGFHPDRASCSGTGREGHDATGSAADVCSAPRTRPTRVRPTSVPQNPNRGTAPPPPLPAPTPEWSDAGWKPGDPVEEIPR
ncbi:hypothetical protein ABZ208_08720 [Streptomyces sp. NPDC006208]|uniref:hypothetical protein n=1 Tax=Streptomyces sp. NPDC006208 TaxID=3156734 RepID=UPI0033AC122D